MWYSVRSCPHCRRGIDTHILGLSSGLGPPLINCRHCRTAIRTGRKEWNIMSTSERARFIIISTLYTIGLGIIGGFSVYLGATALQKGWHTKAVDFTGPILPVGMLLWGGIVTAFQSYRISKSNERVSQNTLAPNSLPQAGVDLDSQIIFCGLLLLPFMIGSLLAYLRQ
jgi:hypothetical protein